MRKWTDGREVEPDEALRRRATWIVLGCMTAALIGANLPSGWWLP